MQARNSLAKQDDKAKLQDTKYREMPDIVIKLVCRYRAELCFKISRKTKLSRLFRAFTDRMEDPGKKLDGSNTISKVETTKDQASVAKPSIQFIFTHNGRTVDENQTPEDVGIEDKDEILAVELMDLTENPEDVREWVRYPNSSFSPSRNQSTKFPILLMYRKSMWNLEESLSRKIGMTIPRSKPLGTAFPMRINASHRAKKTLEDIFDGV